LYRLHVAHFPCEIPSPPIFQTQKSKLQKIRHSTHVSTHHPIIPLILWRSSIHHKLPLPLPTPPNPQNTRQIFTPITIIRSAPYGYESAFEYVLVAFLDELVGTGDEGQGVCVV
jgi:hypothetical protein